MSTLVTCPCGAKVRLPETSAGKEFRCPRCKAEFVTTVDAKVLVAARPHAGQSDAFCPICQTGLAATDEVLVCPECDQVHHKDCWREVGGCSTYGCQQAPAASKEAVAAARPLTAWGDTKTCPACGETIKSIALRCRYCQTDFDTVDPLQVADLRRGAKRADKAESLKKTVVVLFCLSLIGCLAPLIVLLDLVLLLPQRELLAKSGPFHLVLAYSSFGLSVLYSFLMLLFPFL